MAQITSCDTDALGNGDYYLLGQAIARAMSITQGYGHADPAALHDYLPAPTDEPWQFRLVYDYLTMSRDPAKRARFDEASRAHLGHSIAAAVML